MTSGSKGLHLYVPMDAPISSGRAREWARLVAEQIERAMPALVVSRMSKALRPGRVLIDWSQNHAKKTTISPYSLRGRAFPSVAAPRRWAELTEPGLRQLLVNEVLERISAGLDPMRDMLPGEPLTVPTRAVGTAAATPITRARALTAAAPLAVRAGEADQCGPRGGPLGVAARFGGPVEVALARAQDSVPGPAGLPGGSRYELKFDGYRGVLVARRAGMPACGRAMAPICRTGFRMCSLPRRPGCRRVWCWTGSW